VAIRTIQRSGSRFYFNEDAPDIKYPGVTSVVGMLPKPFLAYWQAKMVAELAVDSLDFIEQMAQRDRDGAVQYLKGAATRYTKTRAKVGSDAHDLFERLIRGQYVGRVHPDMEPYRRHFEQFLAAVQPELVRAEDVAWSDTHEYAGSFDGILRLKLDENGKPDATGEPALVMADWKTSKATYPDVALQMSAYAHADFIVSPDGTREAMPKFDGAVVLHITQDQAAFKPVRIDEADVFAHFLHLRSTFEWDRRVSKTVLGDPIWSTDGALITGTQRRA
jgi:plasmid stabilization system protein ParE